MSNQIELTNIATVENELALAWSDGSESYLPFAKLREHCPCANCQGEPDALGRVVRPEKIKGLKAEELLRYEMMGGYALQLFWGDGHSTGIYTFQYLRKLS